MDGHAPSLTLSLLFSLSLSLSLSHYYLLGYSGGQVSSSTVSRDGDPARVHLILGQNFGSQEVRHHTVHVLERHREMVSWGQAVSVVRDRQSQMGTDTVRYS